MRSERTERLSEDGSFPMAHLQDIDEGLAGEKREDLPPGQPGQSSAGSEGCRRHHAAATAAAAAIAEPRGVQT
jgi:hypothetical protein